MISPMHWTPLRMALQELKNTMFYNWLLRGSCSMLLPQGSVTSCPFLFCPRPYYPFFFFFFFLQSDDVRLSFLILGNLLYKRAAANLNMSGRTCKAEMHLFPSYKVASFLRDHQFISVSGFAYQNPQQFSSHQMYFK